MKKLLSLLFALLLVTTSVVAQGRTNSHQSERRAAMIEHSDVRPITIYAEAFGNGLSLLSLNVDTRFSKTLNGLGGHTGVSFIKVDDFSMVTIPVGVNYLLGKRGKYFELGAGATAMISFGKKQDSNSNMSDSDRIWSDSRIAGTLKIGYRYQPVNGGFSYGFGFAPVYGCIGDKFTFWPYLPYFRIGYTF